MYPERSASCQLRETGGVVRGSGLSAPVDGLGSARPAVAARPDSRRSGSWLGGVCASLRAPYDGHGLARGAVRVVTERAILFFIYAGEL